MRARSISDIDILQICRLPYRILRRRADWMEKGVIEKASFLYMIIASAIISGAVVAHAIHLERDCNIRDPTYQEAQQFICLDQTDKNQYNQSYTCINFANDFRNNALNEGYRCGYVTIEFPEARHTIVCFNTSDNGLIFIEPQNDEMVTLTTEQPYLGRMILRFSIIWPIVSEFPSTLVLSLIIFPLFVLATLPAVMICRRKHIC